MSINLPLGPVMADVVGLELTDEDVVQRARQRLQDVAQQHGSQEQQVGLPKGASGLQGHGAVGAASPRIQWRAWKIFDPLSRPARRIGPASALTWSGC